MYQFSYAEIVRDTFSEAREREREAIDRGIALLRTAEDRGIASRETIAALHYVRSLWSVLIEDLARPENDLPETLRADLISIGLWVLREAEALRLRRTESFRDLIEINCMISEGLK